MHNRTVELVDIDSLIRSIKSNYRLESKDRIREIIFTSLDAGVSFRNQIIKTTFKKYNNKLTNSEETRYYFRCPQCDSPVRKMYALDNDELGCRKCCKIKTKTKINSQADRILKIQKYMHDLFNGQKLSTKKKRQLTNYIINHYNNLDAKYRFAYNTFVFKEIQNWCLTMLGDNSNSKDYKEAVKDMLGVLKASKTILVKTGLAKTKKKDFKI